MKKAFRILEIFTGKTILTIAVTLFAILMGGYTATAADIMPAPAAYNWNGFHAGLLGTYGWANSHHCDNTCPDNPLVGSGPTVAGSGLGGGLTIGVNHTFNNILLGAEADYSITGLNGNSPSQVAPGFGCGAGGCATNVTSIGTARLRLGMPFNNVLPYLTGGLAVSSIHGQLGTVGADTTFLNATAGTGIEVGVTQRISIKAEYLHIFDNGQRFIYNPASCAAPGCSLNHYSSDLARVGINFNF